MARRKREPKEKKLPEVKYEPVKREHAGKTTEPYNIMESLVGKHHRHLNEGDVRMLIGWDKGPAREDADGYVKFGRVRKGNDIDREHGGFDYLLVIRKEVWDSFDSARKHAEIDRLLCRCGVKRTAEGEIAVDEKNRALLRTHKPVEVFPENVARYGFHQQPKLADCLERFNDRQRPLLKGDDEAPPKKKAPAFSEPANAPAESQAATNGHADGWRGLGIDVLGMPNYVEKSLKEFGITTLGELEHHEQNGTTLTDIKGISGKGAEIIEAAVRGYRAEHAEQFQDAGA